MVSVWLLSSVFFSLDLSELAKAAKKKLQAVSWVELWDLSNGLLYIYITIRQSCSFLVSMKVTVRWLQGQLFSPTEY